MQAAVVVLEVVELVAAGGGLVPAVVEDEDELVEDDEAAPVAGAHPVVVDDELAEELGVVVATVWVSVTVPDVVEPALVALDELEVLDGLVALGRLG